MNPPTRPDRRRFLMLGAATAAASLLPAPADAYAPSLAADGGRPLTRWLELFNTHTSETLQVAYRDASGFVGASMDKLRWLLRDHRANEAGVIDSALFDQLADKAVPLTVWPVWILVRPAIRSLVLALAAGAVEQILPLVRAGR